jgi:hypothetical protein
MDNDNVVEFPDAPPGWSCVEAKTIDALIASGYLRHDQRHNWCAVLVAHNNLFGDIITASTIHSERNSHPS